MERECPECEAYDREHDHNCKLHADYDPTPWCRMGHSEANCDCGPIAEND